MQETTLFGKLILAGVLFLAFTIFVLIVRWRESRTLGTTRRVTRAAIPRTATELERLTHIIDTAEWSKDRIAAIQELAKLRDKRSLPFLLKVRMRGDSGEETAAIEAVADIGEESPVDDLISWASEERVQRYYKHIHRDVIRALGRMGHARAIPWILSQLAHKDSSVRFASVQALAGMSATEVVPVLSARLKTDGQFGIDDDHSIDAIETVKTLSALGWRPDDDWMRGLVSVVRNDFAAAISVGAVAAEPLLRRVKGVDGRDRQEDRDSHHGGIYYNRRVVQATKALESLLQQCGPAVDADILIEIMSLNHVTYSERWEKGDDERDPGGRWFEVDVGEVKTLAASELERRTG